MTKKKPNSNKPIHSEENISKILELKARGVKDQEIADQVGVKKSYIRSLLRRKKKEGMVFQDARAINSGSKRLPEEAYNVVKELHAKNLNYQEIADSSGLTKNQVYGILQNLGLRYSKEARSEITSKAAPSKLYEETREYQREYNKKARADERLARSELIKELFYKNYSNARIAQEAQVQKSMVKRYLSEMGLQRSKEVKTLNAQLGKNPDYKPFTEDEIAKIVELRKSGVKNEEIAVTFKRPLNMVSYVLYQRDIKLSPAQRVINYQKDSKYTWGDVFEVARKLKLQVLKYGDSRMPANDEFLDIKCHCGKRFSSDKHDFIYSKVKSCGCVRSGPQNEIYDWVLSKGFNAVNEERSLVDKVSFDIHIPEKKLIIEYCGLHWHGERVGGAKARGYQKARYELCKQLGLRLVTIFADEWLMKPEVVKSYLSSILGLPKKTMGARVFEVKEVEYRDVIPFLIQNHLQGASGHKALTLSKDGVIYAALTLKQRENNSWEVSRYCIASDVAIPGGFQRLTKAFIDIYKPSSLYTFADLRWSNGDLYRNSGWDLVKVTQPSYWYFKAGRDLPRYHKSGFRLDKLKEKYGVEGGTEWELAQSLKFDRIWDIGLQKWMLTL